MNDFLKDPLWTQMAIVHEGSPERYTDDHCVFSTYTLKLNLLTFIKGRLIWPVRIMGLPLSLASPGYAFDDEIGRQTVVRWVKAQKGLTLILNGDPDFEDVFISMETLPTLCLDIFFATPSAYYESLRAHYRYRFKSAKKKFEGVNSVSEPIFDAEMYSLYEAVYNKSAFPLEKCTPAFFETFTANTQAFYADGKLIGFYQYTVLKGVLYFIFCGLQYEVLGRYDTYYNMLLHLLEKGITLGVKTMDFGQTTEDIKQKLGAIPVSKKIYLHHSHPFMRFVLKRLRVFGSYKAPNRVYHVFKRSRYGHLG